MLQFDILLLPPLAALLITVSLVTHTLRSMTARDRDDRMLLGSFAFMNAFGAMFAGSVFLQLIIVDPEIQAALIRLNGVVNPFALAMICLGVFAIEYTGRSHWISKPYLAFLAIYVGASLTVFFLEPSTVPGEITTIGSLKVVEIQTRTGRLHLPFTIVAMGHHFLAIGLFASLLFSSQSIYRKQGAVMTVGAIAVLALGIPLGIFFDYPTVYQTFAHLSPFVVFGVGLYRYKLVEYIPVARKTVVDEMNEGYLVLDDDGTILDHNPAAAGLFSHESGLIGANIGEVIPESETLFAPTGAESVTVELPEEDRFLSLTASEMEYADRTGHLLIVTDITELKVRENDLDLLKQVLTRVFRHNVRNELGVVRGHTEILEENVEDGLSENVEKIRRSAERLLDHSEKARRIEQVVDNDELYQVDFVELLPPIVRTFNEDHPDATISLDIGDPPPVQANPEISAAIEELLENAIQHAPADEAPHIEIRTDVQGETVTLLVEDESGGLDSHEIEVLDRAAESDLIHGSGVGLWLIRWIVDRSGGELIVRRTDEGTVMGLKFQRADSSTENAPNAVESAGDR